MTERPPGERPNIADLDSAQPTDESIADAVQRGFTTNVGYTNPGSQTDLVGAEPLADTGDVGVDDPGAGSSIAGRDQTDVTAGGADQPRHESSGMTHSRDHMRHESSGMTHDDRSGGSTTSW